MSEDAALQADTAAKLLQAGDLPGGLKACRAALALHPGDPDLQHMAGLASLQMQRLDAAAIFLKRVSALAAGAVLARQHLAAVLNALGRHAEEAAAYRAILEAEPGNPVVLANLGAALLASGRPEFAAPYLRRVIALAPDAPEPLHTFADACRSGQRHAEALDLDRRALAIRPGFAEALNGLGLTFRRLDRVGEAIACFARATEFARDYAEAHNNLGNARHLDRQLAPAAASYRRAIALKPAEGAAHANLGHARMDLGDVTAAIVCYRRAIAVAPGNAAWHTSLIFALDYAPGLGFAEQQAERRHWHRRHALPLMPSRPDHPNTRDPERRLKLGFVSADFREHSAASVFGPVLRRLDRGRFEIVCYSGVIREDDVTRSFRRPGDGWRPIRDLPPAEVARQIRADSIDILIDLAGHSAGNQLLAFAAKPAPVQVSAWGQATGTGLAAMDYFFADPVYVPGDARPLFAERIYDLPCLITFELPEDAPDVAPPPAAAAPFTFGCFNRTSKIAEDAIAAWARILALAPGTRLLMKDPGFDEAEARARIASLFARHGIAADRIEMRGRTPRRQHLASFADVDLALDPFPYNGGVSTLEALYMGVPVLALAGASATGRLGASILTAAGLPSWLAADVEDYVAKAVGATRRPGELAAIRPTLRRQLASSAVGDADAYTRAVEAAFRTIWRRWCEA